MTHATPQSGLAEILGEISPIEDFSGSMSLSFSNPRFEDVKASIEECKDKDMTYAAPLFVTAEFTNNTTGEIKSQTVFMGDFPMMTRKGTFVINGTERVVVSQLVRSPGVYFDRTLDKTSDVDVYGVKVIPGRGAWLEFDVDKRSTVGVRIDRKRRQPVTVLLKALGWTDDRIREHFGWSETLLATLEKDHIATQRRGAARHLPQAAPGRAADARVRAGAAGEPVLQPQALRPGQGRPLQGQQEARRRRCRSATGTLTEDDIVQTIEYLIRLHAGDEGYEVDDIDHFGNRRLRTVGELIQNQIRVGLSRMERVVRERMTTQDVEAITPQTLINIRPGRRLDQGVLRHLAAVAVHGPDQPARRSDPQAPAVRARPGWSVPRPRRHGGPRRPPVATTAGCARSRPRKARTSA